MPRPRQISDEQILSAMRRSVLERGPAVSLEVVASSLAVSVPALLKRFGTRQNLMIAALRPNPEPAWLALAHEGPVADRPLEEQLHELLVRMYEHFREAVPCIVALRESGIADALVFPKANVVERAFEAVQRWLQLGRRRGVLEVASVDTAVSALIGAVQAHAFQAHVLKLKVSEPQQRRFVRDLARFLSRSLSPRP